MCPTQYQYDNLNRLTGITRPNGEQITYNYDTRGNRTKLLVNNAGAHNAISGTFSYNNWDELTQFTTGGRTYQYKYDSESLRTKKESTTGTIRYHLDNNGQVIAESNANGQVTAQNIWGHKALARKVNGAYYYYIYNGHGDVVQVLNTNGNIVNSYTYDEWGNILSKTEQISNPIRYAGEYYDEESGLYYLRARYYDPVIGRFISEDSNEGEINNPLSLNLYTYCENDPIIYSDPTGNYAAYVVQALESPYGQEIIAAKALGMKVGQYVSLYGPLIENKAIAAVDKGKKAVSSGSKWLKGKLSSSGGKDPNKFKGTGKALSPSEAAKKILKAERTGSALKSDIYHRAPSYLSKSQLSKGKTFNLTGGDGVRRTLLQVKGEVNGKKGVFEYILGPDGKITHQLFKPGGKINGIPN